MNRHLIIGVLAAFVAGIILGKSLSLYRIERGPTKTTSSGFSYTHTLKINTLTGKTWRMSTEPPAWMLMQER